SPERSPRHFRRKVKPGIFSDCRCSNWEPRKQCQTNWTLWNRFARASAQRSSSLQTHSETVCAIGYSECAPGALPEMETCLLVILLQVTPLRRRCAGSGALVSNPLTY